MCYAHAEFDLFTLTKIMARNGVGKSSIVAVINWVLYNCDGDLKDNPNVRREVNGKPVDDMDTYGELTFDIDGKEITMKKVQVRTYNKDKTGYKMITHITLMM